MPGERRTAASARSDGGRNLLELPASGKRKDTVRRGQMLYACCGVRRLFARGSFTADGAPSQATEYDERA